MENHRKAVKEHKERDKHGSPSRGRRRQVTASKPQVEEVEMNPVKRFAHRVVTKVSETLSPSTGWSDVQAGYVPDPAVTADGQLRTRK